MGPTTAPVITPAPTTTPQQKCYTFDQLVTLTVAEAWDLSGRNVTVFRDIVRMMANVSAQKRGIAIPNTTTAGMEIGRTIRQRAQADPNQLLYSVVDSSVRDYGAAHTPVR
jgi:hypothetical protein